MISINELFKLLGDETRLRIIHLLYHQDLCVCELVEIMKESQPKISKHIAKIRTPQVVLTNRNEQYIYYSLNRNNKDMMAILSPIMKEITSQQPYQNDVLILHNKESFVCTRDES